MDWLRRNPLLAVLAVVAAVLAGLVALEVARGVRPAIDARPARPAAPAEARLMPPMVVANAEQAYPELTARPLWVPTRRPAPQVAAAPGETFKRDQFVLQGVTIAGGTQIALLREKASGKVHRVEKGKDLNGLKLVDVKPESVTLAQGDDREVLELRVQKVSAGGPVAMSRQGPFAGDERMPAPAAQASAPVPAAQGAAPVPAGAAGVPTPQRPAAAPMTAEELIARRRARRTQTPQ